MSTELFLTTGRRRRLRRVDRRLARLLWRWSTWRWPWWHWYVFVCVVVALGELWSSQAPQGTLSAALFRHW